MAQLLGRRAGHPRLHRIHYEHFVTDPAAAVAPLARALELEVDPSAGRFEGPPVLRRHVVAANDPERRFAGAGKQARTFGDTGPAIEHHPYRRAIRHARQAAEACSRVAASMDAVSRRN